MTDLTNNNKPSTAVRQRDALAKPVITQKQLDELLRLREGKRRYDDARLEIITLLDQGAEIEPGPLTARVRSQVGEATRRVLWVDEGKMSKASST